ncbi:MAG: TonB-dependent receptor [Bacteroidia bacterium]|nr:TonB-dependent receptor [Bacteroidia bacterium]
MIKRKASGTILRHILLCGVFFIYIPLQGQNSLSEDTIRIKEVIISRKQISSDLPGFRKISIDTTLLKNYTNISLAELLALSSQVFIKSYGSGGSSTSSLRGTGASHTQVSWNGININNPMLGQTDFSLITSGLIDDVRISLGGASMETGNGGIGGIISLENNPDWSNRTSVMVNPDVGSFSRYVLLAGVKTGNDNFQSVTKAHVNYTENDFPYLNTEISSEPVLEKRENSQLSRKDFLQEFYLRKQDNDFSARIWYQSTDRNLPGSMLIQSGTQGEEQVDESIRSIFSFKSERGKTDYFVTGAWMHDRLDYSNPLASIESKNVSNSFTLKGGIETRILNSTKLRIFINNELNVIQSNNYENNVSRNTASITVIADKKSRNRFGSTIMIRETLDNTVLLIPDFSAGAEFRLFADEDHFLRSGFSRTSRVPSMNDRYWFPGGNEQLKNEYAFLYDLGYKMNQRLSPAISISSELGFFRNLIRDMIQWHPGEYTYWVADNLSRVNSTGFESSFSAAYSLNELSINLNAGYSFTRSVSAEAGTEEKIMNQLIYIPENQANGSLSTRYKNIYSVWTTIFTGRRYIVVDNSRHLPGYTVSNFIAGIKIPYKKHSFDVNFRIENVFNLSYQAIAHYPQPGRSYHISLLYKFINESN